MIRLAATLCLLCLAVASTAILDGGSVPGGVECLNVDVGSDCNDSAFDNISDEHPLLARGGCCSKHKGVCGCQERRTLCCDGTLSPSCTCK